jgi:hypothetical protein
MFPPCSMPSFPTIYSLSWRLCGSPLPHAAAPVQPQRKARCAGLRGARAGCSGAQGCVKSALNFPRNAELAQTQLLAQTVRAGS